MLVETKTSLPPSNNLAIFCARTLVRAFEFLAIRGAPTILKMLWKVPSLRRQLATVRLPTGPVITFRAFDGYWCRYLWAGARYETDVEEIFRRIGNGRVLLDCGANIGYWSVRAAEFGFEQVIAVEANRALLPILRENFRSNGVRGSVRHGAIHRGSGEELFLDSSTGHAQAHIGSAGASVTSVSISDLANEFPAGREVVAKLDVEGCEIAAIEGAGHRANLIFVYEDFRERDMEVTRHLLGSGRCVFAMRSNGQSIPIRSAEEAAAFNRANVPAGSPSNLLACGPHLLRKIEAELAALPTNNPARRRHSRVS